MKEYIVVEDPHHVGHRPITPTQYLTVVYAVAIAEEGRRLSFINRIGDDDLQLLTLSASYYRYSGVCIIIQCSISFGNVMSTVIY